MTPDTIENYHQTAELLHAWTTANTDRLPTEEIGYCRHVAAVYQTFAAFLHVKDTRDTQEELLDLISAMDNLADDIRHLTGNTEPPPTPDIPTSLRNLVCVQCGTPPNQIEIRRSYVDSQPMIPLWEGGPLTTDPYGETNRTHVSTTSELQPCGHPVELIHRTGQPVRTGHWANCELVTGPDATCTCGYLTNTNPGGR